MTAAHLIRILWYALSAIWMVGALRSKRTVRKQSLGSRLLQSSLTVAAFLLLFSPLLRLGILGLPLLSHSTTTNALGSVFTLAGCLLAVWARIILGRNWSGDVTLKQDHTLITRGPYRWTRHPIYSGVLLMTLGTAIVYGDVSSFLAFVVLFIALWIKSRTEECFMQQQFGQQYAAYQQRVKALIPGVL